MPIFAARQGLKAAMWRWTAAQLRNRPWLEILPVSLHLAHTKRVKSHWEYLHRPVPGTLARLAMIATAVSKSVKRDHVIA